MVLLPTWQRELGSAGEQNRARGRSVDFDRLSTFLSYIASLPESGRLTRERLLDERFRLYSEGNLEVYYAPFDYIETDATLCTVGITPVWTQMGIAYRVAREGLARGQSIERISSEIKQTASFAGSMRTSLIGMLNELYLPSVLGVSSSAALFDVQHYVTHTTSAIRYPVFVDGENYTGHHPRILKHAKLKEFNRHALCGRVDAGFRGSGFPRLWLFLW